MLLTGHHPAGVGPHSAADLIKAIIDIEPLRPSEMVASAQANTEFMVFSAAHRSTTPGTLHRVLAGDLDTILEKH